MMKQPPSNKPPPKRGQKLHKVKKCAFCGAVLTIKNRGRYEDVCDVCEAMRE